MSVCQGPSESLAHRAQVRDGLPPTHRPARCAAANTAARKRGPRRSPLTPPPVRRLARAACALRDSFFRHAVSVYQGPPEILAHRAQVRDGLSPTHRPARCAAANTAARKRGPRRSPLTPPPVRRLARAACALRDSFFRHAVSVYQGPPEILAHRAQVRDGLSPTHRPARCAAANTSARGRRPRRSPLTPPESGLAR